MSRIFLSIPNLNQGRFLESALSALFAGDYRGISAAVLDGGSSDNSRQVIARYEKRLLFWRSGQDGGQSSAINEGIAQAPGSTVYVGWVNGDDIVFPEGLRILERFLDEHPDHVAAYGRAEIIDEMGKLVGYYPTMPFFLRFFAHRCFISQPASLIRKPAWERVGGLDESLHYAMDYDLWWKLAKIGKIGYVREVIAQSRDHPDTKTRTHYPRAVSCSIAVLNRYIGHTPISWVLREILARDRTGKKEVRGTGGSGRKRDFIQAAKRMAGYLSLIVILPIAYLSANGITGIFFSALFLLSPRFVLRIRKV